MSKKHDVNVKRNSTVNFQIGLIASLLFVYLLFEMYTKVPPKFSKAPLDEIPEETIHTIDRFEVKKKKKTYKNKLAKVKQPVINKILITSRLLKIKSPKPKTLELKMIQKMTNQ